jgi:SAM-dependent methyltransferase
MPSQDVRTSTAGAYDRIVDEYVRRNTAINADLVEFRQDFARAVRDGGHVLDVGCGPGRDVVYFNGQGFTVAGLDASRNMARHARSQGVPVLIGDMRAMPVALGSLDGIWSSASLLHVPRGEVLRTLDAWRSSLRPRGVLGLSTSLGDAEGWEACPYDPASLHDPAGSRRWFVHHDTDQLLGLLVAAGFDVITSRERVSNRRWLQTLARRGT